MVYDIINKHSEGEYIWNLKEWILMM